MPTISTATVPCTVRLSPAGHLLFDRDVEGSTSFQLSEAAAQKLADAFEPGAAHALLRLASGGIASEIGPALGHWRELAKLFLTRLCQHLDPEEALKDEASLALLPTESAHFLDVAPAMPGGEYLSQQTLDEAWRGLRQAFITEARTAEKPLEAYLRGLSPLWSAVGRVFFHLAENKARPDVPFAFLATYTSRVSQQGKLQHVPLGKAVKESAQAADKASLLALLAPLQRASGASEFLKNLVDSGQVFQTLAWTPVEAHRFLREVPLYESHGIFVRVPNWWSARNPPRVMVDVRLGQQAAAGLGTEALLDFSVNASIEGEPLTVAEWRELASQNEGLVLVKGRWIEVDKEKLDELLKHWKHVEKEVKAGGVSFLDGMRLLAGFSAGSVRSEGSGQAAANSWLSIHAGDWLKEVLEELHGHAQSPIEFSPQELRATLRHYQAEGVQWLALLHKLRLGGCLADDMGLGKTLQVLALLVHLQRTRSKRSAERASLLVIPASLLGNWRSECERFTPGLKLAVVHPSEPDQTLAERPESLAGIDLVVTTYSMLPRLEWLRASEWEVVVLDEAQAIKNPSTRQTRTVKELKSHLRLALTGTPVENRLGDLWSLFDFLQPGLLGGPTEFSSLAKSAGDGGDSGGGDIFGKLRTLVRPYLLRRLKSDKRIIQDLPDKQEVKAYCGLKKTQAVLYQQAVDELKRLLQDAEGIRRRGLILTFLMRFKQICNHPSQWTGDGAFDAAESGKMARLVEICEEIAARQEKVLVFTQFREITAPLESLLQTVFGRQGLVLDGNTPIGKRKGLVEAFQSESGPAHFVLSLKAGGTGLNLTAASHVIHFDRWWNPAVENQATDRAYRIGQKRSVLVHKFVCRGTIEEKIDAMLEQKQGLADEILKDGAEKRLTEMTNEELMALVTLDKSRAVEES